MAARDFLFAFGPVGRHPCQGDDVQVKSSTFLGPLLAPFLQLAKTQPNNAKRTQIVTWGISTAGKAPRTTKSIQYTVVSLQIPHRSLLLQSQPRY